MDQALAAFRKGYCFNKPDLQRASEQLIEHYATCDRHRFGFSEAYRQCLLKLCHRFSNALNEYSIPPLTEDWWFYDIEISNDGIDLSLSSCSDFEMDEKGDVQSMSIHRGFTLISVKSEYLTMDEFAQVYDVTPATVGQWIRRGKLRTAKKIGKEWFIPAIADKPPRKFESVEYTWDTLPDAAEERFSYLKGHKRIYIFQDEEPGAPFQCILGYPGESSYSVIPLSLEERENLEFTLISTLSATANPRRITFAPNKQG